MFWKKWFKKNLIETKTSIGNTIDVYDALDLEKFKQVYSSDYSIFQVTTLEHDVVSYTETLNKLLGYLENDVEIQTYLIPNSLQRIYLRQFYIDKNGYFLDTTYHTERFINEVKDFLTTYEEIEKSFDKTFNQDRNIRLLRHVITNLVTLAGELTYG